jgi:superoxide dismutase
MMRQYITLVEAKSQYTPDLEIIKPNYQPYSLAPVMSAATFNIHWGKLAHGYAERFNKGEGDKTFNYAGAWLHNVFFMQFRSPKTLEPNGPVGNLIKQKFKTYSDFKDKFKEEMNILCSKNPVAFYLKFVQPIQPKNIELSSNEVNPLQVQIIYPKDFDPNK